MLRGLGLTGYVEPQPTEMPMKAMLPTLSTVAVVAVAVVLLAGLANMVRGKSPNLSQKLMRWRVGLQLLAILVLLATVYLARG